MVAPDPGQTEIGSGFLHKLMRLERRTHVGHAACGRRGADGDGRELPDDSLAAEAEFLKSIEVHYRRVIPQVILLEANAHVQKQCRRERVVVVEALRM